ncbi:MAG TPA: hypothetical protein VFQ45_12055 [Longimicrobium sp.]|nr:hypothetical protein [Longimicrobium sp.]
MSLLRPRAARRAALATLALLLAACDATGNPFQPKGKKTTGGGEDVTPPTVDIVLPNAETSSIAVGDSLFIRANVADGTALAGLQLEAYAVRGNPDLGTAVKVSRFASKVVNLTTAGRAVRDTTIDRYLIATSDTAQETGIYVVVTAVDTAGNSRADTVRVNIGGPRVQVAAPAQGAEFRGGTQVPIQVVAEDPHEMINSVRVRGSGAFTFDITVPVSPARTRLDTTLVVPVPNGATGTLRIDASTVSGANQTGVAIPVEVAILPAAADNLAPRVTFSTSVPARMELDDTLTVTVSAVDETRVDSIGVTVLAFLRTAGGGRTALPSRVGLGNVSSGVFRFGLDHLGLSVLDTAAVELEITAWADDPAGNCGAATTPNNPQALPCQAGPSGSRVAATAGRLAPVLVVRGTTIPRRNDGDVIADLVADSTNVYLSNRTRGWVDVLPIGTRAYTQAVAVGSQPWGLALGRTRDTLFVANSGGTNISAIPLRTGVLAEDQGARILTPNEVLYDIEFDDKGIPSKVTEVDYSDRPQFIAQTSLGQLVYSTRPTGAAPNGTVRIYDPRKRNVEIFIGYVARTAPTKAIVVNAADAGLVVGDTASLAVCARKRFGDASDGPCFVGRVTEVKNSLDSLRALPPNANGVRYDTRLDMFANIAEVGLADTTFIAVSGDRTTVAVGEGARSRARIPVFTVQGDELVLTGNVRDLINNADERVIGLGLNYDGSLGVARGTGVYYFTRDLRLQGSEPSGSPSGGVAMHPENRNYPSSNVARRSFITGIDAAGNSYIDIFDNFNFRAVRRIPLRDPVVGAMAVAPRGPTDPAAVALRLYAITTHGIVAVEITNADLQ